MSHLDRTFYISVVFGIFIALSACAGRPPAPPAEHRDVLPWGAISTQAAKTTLDSQVFRSLGDAFTRDHLDTNINSDGVPRFAVLALSGGGSNGAFAVGLLSGWSEHGTRPQFKIVTGVSTGALTATYAFLGPEYDTLIEKLYTSITDQDVYRNRNPFSALFGDSLRDTSPLRRMIESWIDSELLARVAEEHRKGRRLYIATTDLDATRLVTWDMGAIAASDRGDRLQRYRDVLLASAAIPVAFPPVYFPTEVEGETYWQMHVDGGASANIFFAGFMFDVQRAIEAQRLANGVEVDFYLIVNSPLLPEPLDLPVKGNLLSIAAASTWSMSWAAQSAQLIRMYKSIRGFGHAYHLAGIPTEYPDPLDSSTFDPESMTQLLQFAKRQAAEGYPWLDAPPDIEWREAVPEGAPGASE
jgi:predicted acylesterase/phospholipase RssA